MLIRIVGFVILLTIAVCTQGFGQKFKDIYPTIEQADDEQALPVLNAYLINNLDHPGANLLVTMIYDRRYKAADVLTEYEMAVANAQRAKLRLAKCAAIVTEKEVKKNGDHYSQFGTGTDSKGLPQSRYDGFMTAPVNPLLDELALAYKDWDWKTSCHPLTFMWFWCVLLDRIVSYSEGSTGTLGINIIEDL